MSRGLEWPLDIVLFAPPPGLEPRQRVPKTRVLPLHHGGTAETYVFCQVFIMPYSSDAAYHGVSRGIVTNFWRIPMRDGSAANGIETIFKKVFLPRTDVIWRENAIIRTYANKSNQYLSEKSKVSIFTKIF